MRNEEYKPYRYKGWIRQAHFDLEAAKMSYNNKFYEWACFQCEQCGEKALKAVMAFSGIRPPKLHKLPILIGLVKRARPEIKKSFIDIDTLQAYTFVSRYPFIIPGDNLSPHDLVTIQNAEDCINEATSVLRFIGNILDYSHDETRRF